MRKVLCKASDCQFKMCVYIVQFIPSRHNESYKEKKSYFLSYFLKIFLLFGLKTRHIEKETRRSYV